MRRHRPLLKSILDREFDPDLGRKIDPSDVIQETFQAVHSNLDKVASKSPRQLKEYLRRVLLSKLQDFRRRFLSTQKRDMSREVTRDELSSGELQMIHDGKGTPLELMIDEEHLSRAIQAIEALPEEVRNVLKWRFEKEMTLEEIGERIGRSKDDVRMLIQRCISRIRRDIDES